MIKSIDKDGYHIAYQDDDIEVKQTLLIEVLPARNFKSVNKVTYKLTYTTLTRAINFT